MFLFKFYNAKFKLIKRWKLQGHTNPVHLNFEKINKHIEIVLQQQHQWWRRHRRPTSFWRTKNIFHITLFLTRFLDYCQQAIITKRSGGTILRFRKKISVTIAQKMYTYNIIVYTQVSLNMMNMIYLLFITNCNKLLILTYTLV